MAILKTSASQVEAFIRCNRYWYNKSVLKLPEPFSPAAAKGSRVHSISEYWLKSGLLSQPPGATDEDTEIAQAAIATMPARGPELLIEHEFEIPTYEGGPMWLGYIDLVDPRGDLVHVLDHKTRSDFRYCLKPEDLLKSIQMISYAKWAMDYFVKEAVLIGHKYVCTKRTAKPPYYKTMLVTAVANRKQVDKVWANLMPVIREMMAWRERNPKTADDLSPNTAACGMYGGCAYRPQCGFSPALGTFSIRKTKTMSDTPTAPVNGTTPRPMSLSEKLAAKKAAAAAAAPPATTAPAAGAPAVGLVPPDAPPNLPAGQPPEDAKPEEKKTKAKKGSAARDAILAAAGGEPESGTLPGVSTTPPPAKPDLGRVAEESTASQFKGVKEEAERKALVAENAAAPGAETAPSAPVKAVATKKRLSIFVDCLPVKGGGSFTLFEDWAAPLFAHVAEGLGLSDYRLAQFASWKPHFANAVRESLDTLPEVLVMSSYGPGVQEALDALTPHATLIVKKLG